MKRTILVKAASLLACLLGMMAFDATAHAGMSGSYPANTFTLMDVRLDSVYGKGMALSVAPAGFIRVHDDFTLRMTALPGQEAEAPSFALGTFIGYQNLGRLQLAVLLEGLAASRDAKYRPELHASLYFEYAVADMDVSADGSTRSLQLTATVGTLGGAVIGVGVGF